MVFLCTLASYQSSEVVGEKIQRHTATEQWQKKQKNMYFIGVPIVVTTGKLPRKEKLSRNRSSVNDTHVLAEDIENCGKWKKINAVANSKGSSPTFPRINILLTRKCWRDECDSWLFQTSHSRAFWKSLSLGCFLNTEGTNEERYHLSICPEIPKHWMPPPFFFYVKIPSIRGWRTLMVHIIWILRMPT